MADLSSILGGMVQGFKDFGTGLVDMFGTGGAAIGDAIESIRTGRATNKNQDDFRKWLYQTDNTQDAAAKGLGTILNGVQTVSDFIPGAGAVTRNPLFNGVQGAIGGVADEFKMAGKDYDLGRAAQRAGVGAASGLASAYTNQALGKTGNKLINNGLVRGAAGGALAGGIANAGYTGIDGGSVQDMINAGLYGAQTGALVGGTTGLARELIKPTHKMDVALTDEEKSARIANIDDQISKLDTSTPEGNARYSELMDARQKYSGNKRLYRGLTQEYDANYPKNKLDTNGYESWTDNPELAKQYGEYVYYIDVPEGDIKTSYLDENPMSETYGDRNPIYSIDKKAGLNGVSGNEYLLSVDDPYKEGLTYNRLGGKPKTVADLMVESKPKTYYHGSPETDITEFDMGRAGKNTRSGEKAIYFTDTPEAAEEFAYERIPTDSIFMDKAGKRGGVYEANLDMRNTLDLDNLTDAQIRELWNYASPLGKLDGQEAFVQRLTDWRDKYHNPQLTKGYIDLEALKNSPYDSFSATMYPNTGNKAKEYAIFDASKAKITKSPKTVADLMLSPEQEEFFKGSVVRDASGNLKQLYHGSANGEFDTFSKEFANAENDWGKGFYFTDNEADVKKNYYDGGPDFDNKIARRAEQLEAELDIPYEQAEKQARNELYKGAYQIDAYTNLENPATVGKTVLFDGSEYPVKNLSDYDGDIEGYYQDLIYDLTDDVLADTDTDYRYHDDLMRTLYDAYAEGGVEPQRLKEMLNELEITDDNGNPVGNEIARSVIQNLGFDGIIDPTVANKFTNMGLDPNTTHYIAFEPNQIKSIKNKKPTSADSIMASKNIGGSSGSAEAEGVATRVGSKNVAQVDLSTLPESMKAAKSYLNKDYIKDIESYSGKKIGDMTDAELMEYALKDKPAETRDIYRVGIEDIVKGGKTMRQVAENYAANRYLRELADKNFDDIDSKALVSYLLNNAHRLNDSKTRAADIELSDRLGIGQSNTFMDDYRVPYDAQGVFDVADSTISIRPELSQESAVNTVAHERLHSFQTENDIKRYDKRVLNAYNDLAKELKPMLKTPEETAKRYRFDADYWGNEREQQSRMLQQYLENKGYTKGGLQEANVGEWGNEINPAFDKFFDKLRALSKKGVALPALTALFGGGAIAGALTSGKDDKKKKSEVK